MSLILVKETGQLIRLEDIFLKDSLTNALSAVAIVKPKIVERLNEMLRDNKVEGSGADAFEETGADAKSDTTKCFILIKTLSNGYLVSTKGPYVLVKLRFQFLKVLLRSILPQELIWSSVSWFISANLI